MKILIIDDNPHHAELAAHRLQQESWQVEVAEEPGSQHRFEDYDFILLDYSMPKRSGLEILKNLRERDIQTPVIFLTGHGNEIIASEAIKQGAYDYVVKDTQLVYLDRLPSVIREAKAKHELIETNKFLIQELRRANERLQRMTFTDEMTGVPNYRFLKRQLESEIQKSLRYDKPLAICVIDVDHFKKINDQYGHPAGDLLLRELASILQKSVRGADFVGRYAGDEFVIVFPQTSLADAMSLCERVRQNVEAHVFVTERANFHSTISIGVADFDARRRNTAEDLVDAADKCLYQAKRAGKNRVSSVIRLLKKKSPGELDEVTSPEART